MNSAYIYIVLGSAVAAVSSYWWGRWSTKHLLRHKDARSSSLSGSVIRVLYAIPSVSIMVVLNVLIYFAINYVGKLDRLDGFVSILPLMCPLAFGLIAYGRGIDAQNKQ